MSMGGGGLVYGSPNVSALPPSGDRKAGGANTICYCTVSVHTQTHIHILQRSIRSIFFKLVT